VEHGRHRQRRGRVRVLNYLPKLRVLDFRDARVLLAIFAGPVVAALVIWLVSIGCQCRRTSGRGWTGWRWVTRETSSGEKAPVSYLLSVQIEDGSDDLVVFEVDRAAIGEDQVLASRAPGVATARARMTLEEALASLQPSLSKVTKTLQAVAPDEMEVEFGLKMGGETGIIVARGTAEVNFRVTLCWKAGTREKSGD